MKAWFAKAVRLGRSQDHHVDDERYDRHGQQHPGQPRQHLGQRDQLIGSHVAFSPALDWYLGEILTNALNFRKKAVLLAPGEEHAAMTDTGQ
jgi:hypothetical protein